MICIIDRLFHVKWYWILHKVVRYVIMSWFKYMYIRYRYIKFCIPMVHKLKCSEYFIWVTYYLRFLFLHFSCVEVDRDPFSLSPVRYPFDDSVKTAIFRQHTIFKLYMNKLTKRFALEKIYDLHISLESWEHLRLNKKN